jgi:hypothetical protein
LGKPARPLLVGLSVSFGMLPAVDFHRQMDARAIEIDRERSDRVLSPEMKSVQLIAAKRAP